MLALRLIQIILLLTRAAFFQFAIIRVSKYSNVRTTRYRFLLSSEYRAPCDDQSIISFCKIVFADYFHEFPARMHTLHPSVFVKLQVEQVSLLLSSSAHVFFRFVIMIDFDSSSRFF